MEQIITKLQKLPQFNLIEPYNKDIWDICNWALYKNAPIKQKQSWIFRSNVMNNNMDFTLCKNLDIREEAKYFAYYVLNTRKVSLGTFADYADKFKLFFSYVNIHDFTSVLDIDCDDYNEYIASSHKKMTDNGSAFINGEKKHIQKQNRLFTFLETFQTIIFRYLESLKPLRERDFWDYHEFAPNELYGRNLDFTGIIQPIMRQEAKNFLHFKIANFSSPTVAKYLHDITIFCHWLYEYDESMEDFKSVDRDILEEYFLFLRAESDFSQQSINENILELSVMFEYGLINENEHFPSIPLFLNTDYAFKTKHRADFYTAEEIVSIFSIIKYLPKSYGKILMILLHCGMRISEVLHLPIDCLKYENGQPYIKIYMYKTERNNKVPINDHVHKIIKSQIAETKKDFPDAKYVFLNDSGNPIQYSTFIKYVKKILIEHNILGRDGKPLDFRTHRFRTTKATELINSGHDPQIAANMLGQKSLSSLSYYTTATNMSLNEYMQEYLQKESLLINAIGQMDGLILEDYKNTTPLCNGWCCRPTELGLCDKANACLSCSQFRPSLLHLTNYKSQLAEVKASLAVAKENGYTRMIERCEKDKKALEDIISKLEVMLNEKKH